MRKIEKKMLNAVRNFNNMCEGNTQVRIIDNGDGTTDCKVYLHGNCIYKVHENVMGLKFESFTLAGWNTPTTRSRLRALGLYVSQMDFLPYYNGIAIDRYKWYNK